MNQEDKSSGYGRRSLWQYILIYAVVGIVVYGLIYYFVLSKRGSNYTSSYNSAPAANSSASPSFTDASPGATQVQNTVTLTADGFSSAVLTIKVGTAVTWMNKSGAEATVNSDPHPVHTDYQPLNLGRFPDGGSLSLTFDKPGTYGYHNHLNPSQTGKIIVQ